MIIDISELGYGQHNEYKMTGTIEAELSDLRDRIKRLEERSELSDLRRRVEKLENQNRSIS